MTINKRLIIIDVDLFFLTKWFPRFISDCLRTLVSLLRAPSKPGSSIKKTFGGFFWQRGQLAIWYLRLC